MSGWTANRVSKPRLLRATNWLVCAWLSFAPVALGQYTQRTEVRDTARPKRHDPLASGRRVDAACYADGDCGKGTLCFKGHCVLQPVITAISFVDAQRDHKLPWFDPLPDGAVVHLDLLPPLAIDIETNVSNSGSVQLWLYREGDLIHQHVENVAPFALFGGDGFDYRAWPQGGPVPGIYTLEAVAYSARDARGLSSRRTVVHFELIDPPCERDSDCVDGIYCNGEESCVVGQCVSGLLPCVNDPCIESLGICGLPPCQSDEQCNDGLYCNGVESCVVGQCLSGPPPCDDELCVEAKRDCTAADWTAPLGVPYPEFGIDEQAPAYDDGDPLHYYVDNTHPLATNDGNPNGSPARPRVTIPLGLPAGAVVEVRGGPYAYVNLAAKMFVSGHGTADRPIFVRGDPSAAPPVFAKDVFVRGSYIVFEHVRFENKGIELRPVEGDIHHIAIRHSEFAGFGTQTGGGTIKVVGNPTVVRHVVIYDNYIHDNGDDSVGAADTGRHGIGVGFNVQDLWVVDNIIADNGADSIQVNFHGTLSGKQPAEFVYIARNDMSGDRENAIDLKVCHDVIVSENRIHGYRASTTSSGEAVVIHKGQTTGEFTKPQRIWLLNNEIFDARLGVVVTAGADINVIGNRLHGIHHHNGDYDPESIFAGGVALHARNAGPVLLLHNTLYKCDAGVTAIASVELSHNIISTLSEPLAFHLNVSPGQFSFGANHNLYHQPGTGARILWNGKVHTLDSFFESSGHELSGLESDPRLTAAAGGDFHLLPSSPAIDAGRLHPAFGRFKTRYGLDIAVDFDGTRRPQDASMDIGADEY